MKNIILLFVFIFGALNSFSQHSFYWVNGAGDWQDNTHWSLSSGGDYGKDIPSEKDDVFFDKNSSLSKSSVVTVKHPVSINDLNISTSLVLKGKSDINIYGSANVEESAILKKYKGDIVFASSQKQKIDIRTKLNSNLVFDGKGGNWDFLSDIITRKNIYIKSGTVNTNDNKVSSSAVVAQGDKRRAFNLGSSEIKTKKWDFAQSNNLNFDASQSVIIVPGDIEKNFNTGNLSYNAIKSVPRRSSAKATKALTATITPKDATCAANSDSGTKDDGEIAVSVSGGSGSYVIQLRDGALNLLAEKTGVSSYTFTSSDISNGDLVSGGYTIGYGEDDNHLTSESVVVGPSDFFAIISVETDATCPGGDDLQLKATATGGTAPYTDYTWAAQGDLSYSYSGSTTDANLDMDNYTVVVTDNNSCTQDTNFYYYPTTHPKNEYLVADGRPEDFSIGEAIPTASCEGEDNGQIQVNNVSGGTGPYTYAATLENDLPVFGTDNPILNLAPEDYNVTVKDSKGCESDAFIPKKVVVATVDETPKVVVSGVQDATICEGENYVSTGVSVTNGVNITWSSSDGKGTFDDNTIENPTFTPDASQIGGTVDLTISVTGNGACPVVQQTMTLTINKNPVVDLSVNNDHVCEGTDLLLDGNPSGGSGTYNIHSWTGSGAAKLDRTDIQKPTFNSAAYGNFDLTYKVTDDNSCSASGNITIVVEDGPSVTAGPDDEICEANDFTISQASVTNGTISWSEDGSGSISSGGNTTTPTYSSVSGESGIVNLTATATGTGACSAKVVTDVMKLTVNPLPVPTITGDMVICKNVVGTYTTEQNMTEYTWTVNGGTIASGQGTYQITVNWTSTGTQSVSVSYKDANSCSSSNPTQENVTVHNLPTPDLSVNPTEACQGVALSLDGNPSGGSGTYNAHSWTGDGAAKLDRTDIEQPNFTSTQTGTFTLRYTVTDDNTCSGYDEMTLDVKPSPIADAGADAETCESTDYIMPSGHASASNGDILWETNGSGTLSDGTTLTPTYSPGAGETGKINLILKVTGTGSCAGNTVTDTMKLMINPLPVPTITGDNTSCMEEVKAYSTEANMTNYTWTVAGGTIQGSSSGNSVNIKWNSTTTPSVSINYTDANGCPAATDKKLDVTVYENPTVDLSVNNTTICQNNDLLLDGNPSGGSGTYNTHSWTGSGASELDDVTIQKPTFNSATPNTYDLTYIVIDDRGCKGEGDMSIDVTNGPVAFAGKDTVLCHEAILYDITDAKATYTTNISWNNITTGDNSGFDDVNIQNPEYTFTNADRNAGLIKLVMTASNGSCSDVTDTLEIKFAPELNVSIGGESPYLIDVTTTKINVAFWAEHDDMPQLEFYLIAPDGTEMNLYKYNSLVDGCQPYEIYTTEIDSLVFSLNSDNNPGAFNLCDFANSADPIVGEFIPNESWNVFDGMDPAQGGWSLRVDDTFSGSSGKLKRVRITFLDKDVNGQEQLIVFDSKDIDYPIEDNASTTYTVPIGLRTSCYGVCDAKAIVSVTGGTFPYVSYIWDDGREGENMELCAGDHTVVVTDSKQCSSVGAVTVLQPEEIVLSFDSTNVKCFGDSTGVVKVVATGGSGGPYTYLWNDKHNSTTAEVDSLQAGKYTVSVTDGNSCTATGSVIVGQPASKITVANIIIDSTNCTTSDGKIKVEATGGTPFTTGDSYIYTWDIDGSIGDTLINVGVGNYLVSIEDSLGCNIDTTITMVDKGSMVINGFTMLKPVKCNGGCDGEVKVDFNGGTGAPTFAWSGGGITGTDISLPNVCGDTTYTVIITDANTNCSVTDFYKIPQPEVLENKWVFTDSIVCAGKDSASFYAKITGGVAPYNYLWKNSAGDAISTDSNLVHVKPDKYFLIVADDNTCTFEDSITIFEPAPLLTVIDTGKTSCPGATGWAKVKVTGGVAPYKYNWYQKSDPTVIIEGQNTDSISKLWVDVFVVQVMDSLGCTITDTVIIEDNSGLAFTSKVIHHEWCPNGGDGKAFVNKVTLPDSVNPLVNYTATWSDGFVGDTNNNLFVGSYTVMITENTNGCKAIDTVNIYDIDRLRYDKDSVMNFVQNGTPVGAGFLRPYGGDTSLVDKYYVTWFTDVTIKDTIGTTDTLKINGDISKTDIPLDKGVYYVTLRNNRSDGKECILFDSIHITRDTLYYTIVDSSNVRCFGENTGFIKVQGEGGSKQGYKYTWSNSEWSADSTGNSISNLVAGTYYITVKDIDARGGEYKDSIKITEPSPFYIGQIDEVRPGCTDSTGMLAIAKPDNNVVYEWYYGKDTVVNDTIKNLWVGDYALSATNSRGCRIDSSYYLTDKSLFAIEAKSSQLGKLCYGSSNGGVEVAIRIEGKTPYKYSWFKDTALDTISKEDKVRNLTAGMYKVTVVDSIGCIRYDSAKIEQFDEITFSIKDTIQNTCYVDKDGGFKFSNTTGGDTDSKYTFVLLDSLDNSIITQEDSVFKNLATNKYKLTVSSGLCYSDTIPFTFLSKSPEIILDTFNIIKQPTCNLNTKDGDLAVGVSFGYFGQVSSTAEANIILVKYKWNDEDEYGRQNFVDTLIGTTGGLNTVRITSKTWNEECDTTFTTNLTSKFYSKIDEAYIVSSKLRDDYLCPSTTETLVALTQVSSTLSWTSSDLTTIIGDKNSVSIEVLSDSSQTYTVESRNKYNSQCFDTLTLHVNRYIIDSLIAKSDAKNEQIHLGNELKLDVEEPEVLPDVGEEHNYLWRASTDNIEWITPEDERSVTVKPKDNTKFTVRDSIVISNIEYSRRVCIIYDTLTIEVLPDFTPPKGFSPNADGIYDEWELPGISGYDNVIVQIYDRWGGLVWEETGDYDINKWDGRKYNGKALPSGTYYYLIKYGDDGEDTKTLTGPVTIVR
jgi:gliding motility-associated-like protein